jgi:hypothetical protein
MTEQPPSRFAQLVDTLDHGEIAREADEALAELARAVEDFGGKGSVTLTLRLERKKPGVVVIRPDVAKKIPREAPNASLRYVGPKGELLESDPMQAEFAFQNVTPIQRDEERAGAK